MNSPASSTHLSQAQRRTRYGLNVFVAVLAAAILVVLVNWLVERQLRKNLPPQAMRWIRYDLTATRSYSLSPQTLKVLQELQNPIKLVTLLSRSNPYIDQARDLVDEYSHYSNQLTVEHIDPGRDLARLDEFLKNLRTRYQDQLGPIDQAVTSGRQALSDARRAATTQMTSLSQLLEDESLTDSQLRQFIQVLGKAFARFDSQVQEHDEQLEQTLDRPLPDYQGSLETLNTLLGNLDATYTAASNRFQQAVNTESTPDSVKEKLLAILPLFGSSASEIKAALSALQSATVPEVYDELINQLATPETIVLIGPKQVRVLDVSELFRQPDLDQLEPGQTPELRFQGEEKITGALLSMALEHAPLVVFLGSGQPQALGPRGVFEEVAQRLRNMNFQVQQWSPLGEPGPMGQTMPPGPPPQPKPGQKAVWIVVPSASSGSVSPMASMADQQIAQKIQERLDAGDAALIMLSATGAALGEANPFQSLLDSWAISPQLDRLLLREFTLPNHQKRSMPRVDVEDWPQGLPITQALSGMPAIFVWASPIVLGDAAGKSVRLWPLAQVQGKDIWSERDYQSDPPPELDPSSAGKPYTIAAAAEKNSSRLVVVADPFWAVDEITTNADRLLRAPGLAKLFGAAYPANSELFVNSVHWLAGLDQLIATSPRSQDIRRIGPVPSLAGLQWFLLVSMPLTVAAIGIGVWFVRRRPA